MLILEQIRYESEIRDPSELSIPEKSDYSKKELEMAISFIDELTQPFKVEDFRDTYTEELLSFIEKKRKGKVVQKAHTKERKIGEVPDLMAELKKSLELARKGK